MDYDQAKSILGETGAQLEQLVEQAFLGAGEKGQRGREALETQLVGLLASVIGAANGGAQATARALQYGQLLEFVVDQIEREK